MKLRLSVLAALLSLFVVVAPCFALSSGGQRTVEMLVRGGQISHPDLPRF